MEENPPSRGTMVCAGGAVSENTTPNFHSSADGARSSIGLQDRRARRSLDEQNTPEEHGILERERLRDGHREHVGRVAGVAEHGRRRSAVDQAGEFVADRDEDEPRIGDLELRDDLQRVGGRAGGGGDALGGPDAELAERAREFVGAL